MEVCKITVSHSFEKWNFYAPMLPKILFTFVHLHLPSACYSIRHWPIVHLLPIKCNVFKARKMFYKVNNYSISRLQSVFRSSISARVPTLCCSGHQCRRRNRTLKKASCIKILWHPSPIFFWRAGHRVLSSRILNSHFMSSI